MLLHRILLAALRVVSSLMAGESVLVHCSDGWDRTSQMTAIAMLLLDPYYRSFNGFQVPMPLSIVFYLFVVVVDRKRMAFIWTSNVSQKRD